MKRIQVRLVSLLICLALLALSIQGQRQESLARLVKEVTPAIVIVSTNDGFGTGFFIAPNLIATNRHVVANVENIQIKGVRNSHTYSVEVVATDEDNDLAILRVPTEGRSGSVLQLAKTLPELGDSIFIVGNPQGYLGTVSTGIVSGYRKNEAGGARMQISADISHGSSGSPIFNMRGQVVGIARSYLDDSQRMNFAILALSLQHLLARAIAVKKTVPNPYDDIVDSAFDSMSKPLVVGVGSVERYALKPEDDLLDESLYRWTDTGIMVLKGHKVTIICSGSIFFDHDLQTGPEGNTLIRAKSKIIEDWPTGVFIAAVGANEQIYRIGEGATFTAPVTGTLFLGINHGSAKILGGNYEAQVNIHRVNYK